MADNKTYPIQQSRRQFLRKASMLALGASPLLSLAATDNNEGVSLAGGIRPLVKYPGKRDLILVHSRPPHLETPFSVFNESLLTPNDAFYVRYHLANFPTEIDLNSYKLNINGAVKKTLQLSLEELKSMAEPVDVVAVNQCSGNSRGYSSPRVFGAQLSNGAMGNARWTGIPLRTVLEKAGVSPEAMYVTFNGLDKPVLPTTPDFKKALNIEHALSPEPLLAWGMNGEDLPFLNGYPLKLIVPGYFGTYWVKHLSEITVLDTEFTGQDSYFMNTAYQLPDNDCLCVTPGSTTDKSRPISTLPVRSFITNISVGDTLPSAEPIELEGIAFDDGSGIKDVDISIDGGLTWLTSTLGESLGRFSFLPWKLTVSFAQKGKATVMVRASNKNGEVQPLRASWNHGGYRRHAIESVAINVT